MFKKSKSFLCAFFAIACIVTLCVTPVSAASEQQNAVFASMTNALEQKKSQALENFSEIITEKDMLSAFDASSFYDSVAALDTKAFGRLQYEIPTTVDSSAHLNLQYVAMKQRLSNLGYGKLSELEIPKLDTGYSTNITETFASVYGDLSYKYDKDAYSLDGIDMTALVNKAREQRDKNAADIKQTDAYKSVNDSIATNKVIVQSLQVLEDPELKDVLSLESMLNEASKGIADKWATDTTEKHQALETAYSDAVSGLNVSGDMQALFDAAVGDSKAWCEAQTYYLENNYRTRTELQPDLGDQSFGDILSGLSSWVWN